MTGETMNKVAERRYLTIAEGTIANEEQYQRNKLTVHEVDVFAEDMQTDKFDKAIAKELIPDTCVDGRNLLSGACAAGGSFSIVMGDALTNDSYRTAGEKAPAHAKNVFKALANLGKKIGGHRDNHATGPNCGCGAEDKLDSHDSNAPSILEFITRRGKNVRETIESLGVEINDNLHKKITTKAQVLRDTQYATSGAELEAATVEVGGEAAVATVFDTHNEVLVRINTKPGTTIDRKKVRAVYGDRMQLFELDVWALQNAAEAIASSPEEAHEIFVAMLYYNVATTAVLSSADLRVIVR